MSGDRHARRHDSSSLQLVKVRRCFRPGEPPPGTLIRSLCSRGSWVSTSLPRTLKARPSCLRSLRTLSMTPAKVRAGRAWMQYFCEDSCDPMTRISCHHSWPVAHLPTPSQTLTFLPSRTSPVSTMYLVAIPLQSCTILTSMRRKPHAQIPLRQQHTQLLLLIQ